MSRRASIFLATVFTATLSACGEPEQPQIRELREAREFAPPPSFAPYPRNDGSDREMLCAEQNLDKETCAKTPMLELVGGGKYRLVRPSYIQEEEAKPIQEPN